MLVYGSMFHPLCLKCNADLPRCKNAVKIGIAFEAQRVEHAAVDEHDQRLDAYVTERGIYKWK